MAGFIFLSLMIVILHVGVQAEQCKDASQSCKGWADKGYCKHTYVAHMRKNCKESCKICVKETQKDDCSDEQQYHAQCKGWKSYCDPKSKWNNFMKENCKETCGYCVDSCKDNSEVAANCAGWETSGFCKKGTKFYEWMIINCKKSCGQCGKANSKKSCGLRGLSSERVIGGVEASPHTWPWSVALLRFDVYFCGGSLINDQWVVTAAHCLFNREHQVQFMDAVLGEHDRSVKDGNEKKFGIEKIFNHPDYDGRSLSNDIALIKLKNKVELKKTSLGTPDKIGTVCLPKSGEEVLKSNQECYIMGWGKTAHPGPTSEVLMEAKMPIVSNTECKSLNGQLITDKMFCAGNKKGTIQSGCHGDSGGPFVCSQDYESWTLVGVVSWGSKACNRAEKYTVFARVSKFTAWIEKTIKNN